MVTPVFLKWQLFFLCNNERPYGAREPLLESYGSSSRRYFWYFLPTRRNQRCFYLWIFEGEISCDPPLEEEKRKGKKRKEKTPLTPSTWVLEQSTDTALFQFFSSRAHDCCVKTWCSPKRTKEKKELNLLDWNASITKCFFSYNPSLRRHSEGDGFLSRPGYQIGHLGVYTVLK